MNHPGKPLKRHLKPNWYKTGMAGCKCCRTGI